MPQLTIREWLRRALRFGTPGPNGEAPVFEDDLHTREKEWWRQFQAESPEIALRTVQVCVKMIREMNPENQQALYKAIDDDPDYWVAPVHSYWGMAVRNHLREKVGPDSLLPEVNGEPGNWDNFYVVAVEHAVEILRAE